MAQAMLEYSVDRVARVLEEHRQLVQRFSEAVNRALASTGEERQQEIIGIRDLLSGLRGAREGLLKSGTDYLKIARCCLRRDESLEALFSYYLIAGHKLEEEAIQRAAELVGVKEELDHIKMTMSELQDLLVAVSGLRGRASPSGPG